MGRMVHQAITDDLLDLLALHAMDLLEPPLATELEEHLSEGCEPCKRQLYAFRHAFAALARTAPTVRPAPHVKDQILSWSNDSSPDEGRIEPPDTGAQVWKTWEPAATVALHIVRGGDEHWETVHSGVRAKQLYVDRERDMVTMLVRMDPGASYIPHKHEGPEQCFVLEGDLRDGDVVVTAGDFQCAAKGSVHGAQSTESGCLLLVVSSLRDQLL